MTIDKHHVATTLNYWDDPGDGSKPTPIFIGKGRISNKRPHKAHDFVVSDVSGEEDRYTLDGQGFQYCQHKSREELFTDEQQIRTTYYPECEQLVKAITGARQVHIFNHKSPGRTSISHDVIKKRYQIINVWRPIRPILKDPIAVADSSSVPDADLVGAEMTEDGFVGESWVVRHSPGHRWYYKHGMTPEDVLLIKCFDSDETVARRALHSAFEDPAYRDCESRQSIEVRCLVCY
ncbi:hypothetical protein ACCO45_012194 [Purpureocillium lilacinum]|uniref:Uncharacterized protein n=1 Tax=Purpureocillium lilacinum TaxID=33203 RepID=A0ACC4DDQ6_PURLI